MLIRSKPNISYKILIIFSLLFFVAESSARDQVFHKVTIPKFGESGNINWVLQAKFVSILDQNVYNVGNPTPELSMEELAEVFCNTLDYQDNYEIKDYPEDYPSEEPLRRCPNVDKVAKHTGIQSSVSLQTGLVKMLNYYKDSYIK